MRLKMGLDSAARGGQEGQRKLFKVRLYFNHGMQSGKKETFAPYFGKSHTL
jgi:hypothetical protein